jgi:hypothetical protein
LTFRPRYGLFEPTVKQFRTTNAAADFPSGISNAIRDVFDDFASVYLDDQLTYGDSDEEPIGHVKWIMQRLLVAGLYLKPEKCKFHKEKVMYLGLMISTKGISMDDDKVETVWNRSRVKKPTN